MWHWTGEVRPGERLMQLVGRRIGQLADDEQHALELLAVGEPLSRACVLHHGIAHQVQRLARRGVLTTGDDLDRDVRLGHPLFGEVLRTNIPALELDAIRVRLADALDAERAPGDDQLRFRAALWRAQCDDLSNPDELCWAAR